MPAQLQLSQGFSIANGLALIAEIHEQYPTIPLFVMAYANLVYTPGVAQFVDAIAHTGACGLIVPDLPFDSDEGLADACMHLSNKNEQCSNDQKNASLNLFDASILEDLQKDPALVSIPVAALR